MQNSNFSFSQSSINVFKRRRAINISCKSVSEQPSKQISSKQISKKIINKKQKYFTKIDPLNIGQQILTYTKQLRKQQKLENILQNIIQRGNSFCKFGVKSYQKRSKKVLMEALKLSSDKLKGTIFSAQLWSKKNTIKYFQQNKIYMQKNKFIDQLKRYTQKKLRDQQQQQNQQNSFSRKRISQISNIYSQASRTSITNNQIQQFKKSISNLKNKLKQLNIPKEESKQYKKLNQMQTCLRKINQLNQDFLQNMSIYK